MSFKDYFNKSATIQALANKSAQEIGAEVESVGYHQQDIVRDERFIPQVDYTLPGTFARYGLAEEYYNQSLKRIYDEYPYDGSLEERVKWENESTYLDLHIFDKEYPRTNGYISFSPSGWGSLDGSLTSDGYGLPATLEYIALQGGPHPNPDGMTPYSTQFTGSNYYETAKNRENNLKYDLQNKGVTVEFWLKKAAFDPAKTEKEVIYDLYNGGTEETDDYGRLTIELSASGPVGSGVGGLNPFIVTLFSGNVGIATASVCPDTLTTASVADNAWHHYAFTFMSASTSTGVDVNFYIDGTFSKNTALTTFDPDGLAVGLNEVTGALQARLGALITSPSGSSAAASAGKLSASLDEFRYWKTERTGKDIGRYWFTQVGGGTNDDPTPYVESTETINTNLGVYYKFNEGITGVAATDAVVLDFSGRITNGAWTGYTAAGRSTGSAIVESSAAIKEFKDPIIYSFHPAVSALSTRLQISGSNYDVNNNASIYNTIPSWMVDEDLEGQSEIKHLTQILSSYFDTLHLQVESLSKIQNVEYVSGSSKPYPFADRRLASQGLFAPNLFLDADVLEKLADRSEDRLYEKSLTDIKNTIYQNIYNNLVYIYKSKGTEKAFRNMIRCFGIDDELVKLNAYAGNLEYDIRDNRRIVSVAEKFIDFNTADNSQATVFQFQNPGDTTNTSGYLPGNTELTGGYATTLEVDVLFPLKPDENSATYVNTNVISSSLFGLHGAVDNEADTSWDFVLDASNFQVYAARDEITSDNARFTLTSTAGGVVPDLQSPLFEDVYNNTHWNLAVRIKPEQYPWAGAVVGYSDNYTIELHGVQLDAGIIQNEFTVTGAIASPAAGFVSGSKRVYVGAHRTNFTGALLQASDVKIDACRYWLDYLDDEVLAGHAYDTQNYGSLNPHYYAFPFASASFGEVLQADTLVFNWEFSNNTGSNASGQFRVADESSGSAAIAATRFGWAGDLLTKQYTSLGYNFPASSTKTIDKDFILSSKLQLPENVQSSDMVNVLNKQDQNVFTRDSRPVNYFFAFEKSMAQAVSVEMINYFATLKDINNIIGAPVNRYRTEYKGLKILRQRFFERVSNDVIDFDKFYEFYKWFDTSLSTMIQQLIPASADFAENVRTLIESHVLERSKYQHKFQNVKQQLNTIEGTAVGSQQTGEMNNSPDSDPQGTGFYSLNAFSRRQLGSSQPIDFKSWNLDHAPIGMTTPAPLSLLFDGTDEYVDIGSAPSTWNALIGLAGADALPHSYSLWIKPAAWVSSNPGIIMFGDNDRGLSNYLGTGPGDTRLYARINSGGNGRTATAGQLTQDVWQHITVTYAGGMYSTGTDLKIYINGSEVTYASTSTGTPTAVEGVNCVIGSYNPSGVKLPGNMCDVAVWDKELSSAEITEIYGAGYRVNLSNSSCQSNLLSWWKLGNGTGDSYNGTLTDEVGGRPGTPTNFDAAGDIEADSPAFSAGYNGAVQNSKTIWWRSRAGRSIAAISSSEGTVNTNKQVMLNSIEKGNTRAQNSVYRFGAGGNRTFGGVGSAANKKVNFVFKATEPFGHGTHAAPENVIIGLGSGVEQLINTTDEYHPAFKQRLGFDMDPNANRGNADSDSFDGNVVAPFSIYSSSLDSGANVLSDTYATGTIITNLHHDLVYDSDIPAQGPFTEQFVGGRQFRHTPLNQSGSNGVDQASNRAEGWKIESSGVSSSATTEYATPMLGIVPPNYDGTAVTFYDADIPTAHRLRNVGTKRPVNIQNIKMTTASAGTNLSGVLAHGAIGNYQKNYQVVQSNSRRKNDPYFNDQSFDFAPYPETLATRGRFPLTFEPTITITQQRVGYAPSSKYGLKFLNKGYGNNFNTNTACLTSSITPVELGTAGGNHAAGLLSASNVAISIWLSASENMCQYHGEGDVWTSGEHRTLFWYGGAYNGTLDNPGTHIYLKSGSTFANGVSDGPTLNLNVGRKAANMSWQSEPGLFSTPGWYNVTVALDYGTAPGGWPEVNEYYDFLTGSNSGVYVNGVTASQGSYTVGVRPRLTSIREDLASIAIGSAIRQGYMREQWAMVSGTISSIAVWTGSIGGQNFDDVAPLLTGSNLTSSTLYSTGQPCGTPTSSVKYGTYAGTINYTLADGTSLYPYDHNYQTNMCLWYNFISSPPEAAGGMNGVRPHFFSTGQDIRLFPSSNRIAVSEFVWDQTIIGIGLGANDTTAIGGTWDNTFLLDGVCTFPNEGGTLDYTLPSRTGSNSNQSIIVNRYAGSGYEVMSRGFMGPAHEEMSVYNALPYHNLHILDYGLSGSASADPVAARTITVVDQIDKNRGLDQRASLHCGPFGSDAAYGSVPASTYVTVPSWQKTNRNARTRMQNDLSLAPGVMPAESSYTASVYDNLYVQHQIPQSEQQYAWITASMASGEVIYGLDAPSCISSSTITQLMTGSQHTYFKNNYLANFVGMSDFTLEVSPDSSTHLATPRTTLPLRAGTFNGTSSKLVIGTSATTPWDAVIGGTGASAKAFTLAAWIAPDNTSGTRMIFSFGNYERRFYWSGTNLYFNIDGTSDGTVVVYDVVPAGKWTHVTATFKGGDPGGSGTSGYMKLYVNGVLQTVTVSSELNNPDDINEATFNSNIGVARTSDYEFDGEITEAAVWDEELTAADISTIYDQQFGGVLDLNTVGVSDLIAYYKFDTLLGDSAASVINRATSPTANTDGVGTDMSLGTYLHLSSVTGSFYRGSEYLKVMLNNQNGPYGWPTWKQIRAGETKVARSLRKQNLIGQIVPPPALETDAGQIQGLQANTFVDYIEQPIASNAKPVFFAFEDNDANPDVANNLAMNVSYQNNLDYFSNEGLNNRLGVNSRRLVNVGTAFNTVADFTLSASLSTVIRYGERIYPAKTNAYQTRTRTRTEYSIADIWNDVRSLRSVGAANSQGDVLAGASMWPLDAHGTLADFTYVGQQSPATNTKWRPGNVANVGSGELQNGYARFAQEDSDGILAAPSYVFPIGAGSGSLCTPVAEFVIAGDLPWLAPSQSGLVPYQPYIDYSEKIRLIGKDMSIVPEFRISEHLEEYTTSENTNFLAKLDSLFTLTGSAVSSSSGANFYKLYSTADFMKYFKVVDDELADKTNGGSQPIRRHSIELSCDAMLQFLPYKGFYPAERTQELASLLSQSIGSRETSWDDTTPSSFARAASNRILYEPLMSPGILFNSIKSGIGCGSAVLCNSSSAAQGSTNGMIASLDPVMLTASFWVDHALVGGGPYLSSPAYREETLATSAQLVGGIPRRQRATYGTPFVEGGTGIQSFGGGRTYGLALTDYDGLTSDIFPTFSSRTTSGYPTPGTAGGYFLHRIPFEAIRFPEKYLSKNSIPNSRLFDTGFLSSSMNEIDSTTQTTRLSIQYSGLLSSPLYSLAIDNFLCETVNFFQTPLKTFVSKQEDEFGSVKKDQYYSLDVMLAKPPGNPYSEEESKLYEEDQKFGMYSRNSSFGFPTIASGSNVDTILAKSGRAYKDVGIRRITYAAHTPACQNGVGLARIIFKAPYSGRISLDDIFSNSSVEYQRDYDFEYDRNATGIGLSGISTLVAPGGTKKITHLVSGSEAAFMQLNESVGLLEKLLVVPQGTTNQEARWMIQTKFESPVLNFWDADTEVIPTGSYCPFDPSDTNDPYQIRGMWHQRGNKLTGSQGIYLSVNDSPTILSSSVYGNITNIKSLSKVVGFDSAQKRIGDFAEAKRIEEAIVCVPFLTDQNERKFFDVNKESQEYVTQLSLLNKYIFPPTFDFLTNQTVDPIAFYAFEFSTDFSQDDLINIWQNLPPKSSTEFQKKTATIKIESLVNRLLDHDQDLQWMVFKVKRRAEKDYNVFTKKGLVDGLPIIEPAIDSPYSYNWPYDYFSLVELIKIDEDVVYATEDLIPEDNEGVPVIPDLREFIPAPEEMAFAVSPKMAILNKSKGDDTSDPKFSKPRRSRKPPRSKKKR